MRGEAGRQNTSVERKKKRKEIKYIPDRRKDETFSFLYRPYSHLAGGFVCREWRVHVCRKHTKNLWRYAPRERERESSCLHFACVFYTLIIRRYQDPFFVLKLSLLLTTSFSFKRFIHDVNNNDLFAGSTPSTITNTEWLAATQASYQNGVEREGAPGKPIALNPMRRNISP